MVAAWVSQVIGPKIEPVAGSSPSLNLQVKAATLTFDRTWSPYIQGTLTCKAQSPADALATDPRSSLGLGVKFTLAQTPLGGSSQTLKMVGWLRGRTNDVVNDQAVISFASVESVMQDYADSAGNTYSAAQTDLTVVKDMLDRMRWAPAGGAAYPIQALQTVDGSAAFNIAAADAGWTAGSSIWQLVSGVEDTGGLWIRGDESGVAVLRMAADYSADTTIRTMTGSDRIVSVVDDVSRDSPDWANAVFVNYPNSAAGTTDYATSGTGPFKSLVLTNPAKRAKAGQAQSRVGRMVKRGRNLAITAVSDLTCRPNQTYRVSYRGWAFTGKVQAVTFRAPDGLMDMTLNVIES